tara:strand:+ start:1640 stop:2251 length:612 start_codon:yes stop_codon:yes gene_type:complete
MDYWNNEVLDKLNNVIKESGQACQGCCMYQNGTRTFAVRKNIEDIRQNLMTCGSKANKIMEVGWNAGHSNYLFLTGNPEAKIINYDLMGHKYSEGCLNVLKEKFNVDVVRGDSTKTIPSQENPEVQDLIHIDGGHGDKCAFHDIINCRRFADKKTLMIMDDTNSKTITEILEFCIRCKWIKEINYEKAGLIHATHHRMFNYLL